MVIVVTRRVFLVAIFTVRFRVSYNLEQTKRTCCRVGSRRLAAAAVVVIEAVIVDQVRLQQRVVE